MDTKGLPLEIIEEILSNLPLKSLRRFSAVSKQWKAMISDEEFLRQNTRRRERILFSYTPMSLMPATTRLLSSISLKGLDDDVQPFVCPLENVTLIASCSDLWCVYGRGSFSVLNPSTGTFKQIPTPYSWIVLSFSSFGMGFDSVADDYKILEVSVSNASRVMLYSLRSNKWRMIDQRFPMQVPYPRKNGVFVSNALHWMTRDAHAIISFDLSTEKFADNFVLPPFDPREAGDEVGLTVLRGKLCLNHQTAKRFVLWEMQEYGDGKSWAKIVDTDPSSLISSIGKTIMTPLYLYQNGRVLMKATTAKGNAKIFMVYEDKSHQIVWRGCDCGSTTGLTYVETLVSPATY